MLLDKTNEMLMITNKYMVIDVFMFLNDNQEEEIKNFRNFLYTMTDKYKSEIEN
jgi:hypothetical protein